MSHWASIQDSASPSAIRAVLGTTKAELKKAKELEEQLANEADAEHQYDIHIGYVERIGQAVRGVIECDPDSLESRIYAVFGKV